MLSLTMRKILLAVLAAIVSVSISAQRRVNFNPLAELNQCVLDSAYGFVVNVIDVL